MAVANVGAWLARWGQRVLVIDWDLEAPGIERYFAGWISQTRPQRQGIMDLIEAFCAEQPLPWRQCLLRAELPRSRPVDILPAGYDDDQYAQRLRSLDWENLFAEFGFGNYLERMLDEWISEYDFVLVDSRTGITDIGGICTIHLPDLLVALTVSNGQSISGCNYVLTKSVRAHADLPVDRRKLLVVPVPARDELHAEEELGQKWRKCMADELGNFTSDWLPSGTETVSVLNYLRIPYKAYWSFGERLAVVEEPDAENPKSFAFKAWRGLFILVLTGLR
jgi:hypothetical protein